MTSFLKEYLEKLIKEQRVSISEFERKVDLNRNTVQGILNGHTKNPTAKTLQKIADFVGCSVKDLLENEDFVKNSQRSLISQSEKKLISLDNYELYQEISNYLIQFLKSKNAKPGLTKIFESINEIYSFCYLNNDSKFDRRFADWSIEKIL